MKRPIAIPRASRAASSPPPTKLTKRAIIAAAAQKAADVRDETRRCEDLARKPGRWLYELTPSECGSQGFIGREVVEETAAVHQTRKP